MLRGDGGRRRCRLLVGLPAPLGHLKLEQQHAGGQGGEIRRGLSSFVWLPLLLLLLVRGHGNYFTAILRRSGTTVSQLVVFAQGKMIAMPVRVLVVDDDEVSRDVFALLLNAAGYSVDTAESGDAALIYLQTARSLPDVILTDLQMPGTSGGELACQLRQVCGASTRLLVMSASVPEDGSERQFDAFLQKPFTIETFAAVVSRETPVVAKELNGKSVAILDENVYRKLAESMRPPKLEQLYAMCLADAEGRLAGMRRAAADGDDAAYKTGGARDQRRMWYGWSP